MNILILGGGGREHSLAWAVKQNPKCDRLIVAPGNAGIAEIAECADLDILDAGAVAEFSQVNTIDFVIVGPEAPLAAGVADRLRAAGVLCFGPSKDAAQLEARHGLCDGVPIQILRDPFEADEERGNDEQDESRSRRACAHENVPGF